MTDSHSRTLLRRAYYSSAGTVLSRGLAAITGLVIARAAGPEHFGVYAAVWSVMGLCFTLADAGIVTGLKREGARERERLPELLGNALLIKAAAVLPALAIAFGIQSVFVQNPLAIGLFVPLAIANFAMMAAEPFFAVLQLRGEQRDASAIMVLRGGILLAGVCVLAAGGHSVTAMAWCQAAVSCGAAAGCGILVLMRVSVAFRLTLVARQIRRSIAFGASELVYSVYQNAPVLFLSRFGTEADVGYFALAQRLVGLCIVAGTTANSQAFLPSLFALYHKDRPRYAQVCAHMQRLFTAAGFAAAAGLYAFSEPIIVLIREAYRPAVPVMHFLCWSVLLAYASIAADAAMTAGDKMRVKVLFQIMATAITVVLSAVLASRHGPYGAAAAVLAGSAFTTVVMGGYALKKRLFSFRGLPPVFLGGVLLAGCGVFTAELITTRPILGGAVFLGGCVLVWYLFFRRAVTVRG